MSISSRNFRLGKLRRLMVPLLALAALSAPGLTATPAQAAKASLPTPTSIQVTNIQQRSLDLRIGGSTTKNYDVYINGEVRAVNAPSSATRPLNIPYLQPGTTYSIRVQQRVNLALSPLSAPVSATTLPGATVAPITNLRVVSTTLGNPNTISIAWDASATAGQVFYDISLNGNGHQATTLTTATLGESLNCYPGPCVGTGPKLGSNVITIVASTTVDGYQVRSAPVSITVNL